MHGMGIVSEHPESGVRVELERPRDGGPPWAYAGQAVTPLARFPLQVGVDAAGEVSVDLPVGAPPELASKVRFIVRAVHRHARAETDDPSAPPPRRILAPAPWKLPVTRRMG
jgi:hypothetical protein